MNTAKKTALPKLPHGEGTMSYDGKGNIVYKKWIVLADGSKYRKTITASSITECFKKMMEEEENASHMEIVGHNDSSLEQEMMYWLNKNKKEHSESPVMGTSGKHYPQYYYTVSYRKEED